MTCPVKRDHDYSPCNIIRCVSARSVWKQCLVCGQAEIVKEIRPNPAREGET